MRIVQFSSDWLFPFMRKIAILLGLFFNTSKMSDSEFRAVIEFFIRKWFSATEITKELADIYGDSAPSYHTIAK